MPAPSASSYDWVMRYPILNAAVVAAAVSIVTWACLPGAPIATQSVTAQHRRWTEPYVYDLAQEVSDAECNNRGCNLTPAINRSLAACERELEGTTRARAQSGCLFLIPAGDHSIDETISVCRAHTFRGRGGNARRALTQIHSTVSAFHGRGVGDCNNGGADGRLTIENLGLSFPGGPHRTPIVAVKAEAKLSMSNVWIVHPDVGVWITASVKQNPKSNANTSRVHNVAIHMTRHSGIILKGTDSNAAAIWAPDIVEACLAAKETPEGQALEAAFGRCGGYVDRSFLGNFAEAGHFAIRPGYPEIRISGDSNHGTCFGCYVEGPTPPLLEAQWSQWIGGIGPWPEGPGFRLDGPRTVGLRVINDTDRSNIVTMDMGRRTGMGSAYYALRRGGSGKALRVKWRPDAADGAYVEEVEDPREVRAAAARSDSPPTSPSGDAAD